MTALRALLKAAIGPTIGKEKFLNYLGYTEYAGSPVGNVTPDHIGHVVYDTSNLDFYEAIGTADTDWAGRSFPDLTKTLDWVATSDSTSASVSVEPFTLTTTMTGAAGVGGRAKFRLDTNVALGGWANALKAHTVFGASGRVSGLGSAFVAELQLSAGTTNGSYTALEAELVLPSGASTGTATSFLFMNVQGADKATFNDNGFFFEMGAGVSAGTDDMFEANAKSATNMTHVLRVKISGTTYYLPLHTSKDFGI